MDEILDEDFEIMENMEYDKDDDYREVDNNKKINYSTDDINDITTISVLYTKMEEYCYDNSLPFLRRSNEFDHFLKLFNISC